MKVRGDDHPGILTLAEIQAQLAVGSLVKRDLHRMVHDYECSRFYLPENVVAFLEGYFGRTIRNKNKFYFREKEESSVKERD